jgi:peptidoglycan hydrolase-like protein with peptidoglycan-binding domain
MTALSISHLPLAVGGAVASSAGRLGLWAIGRFARAPLAYTGIFAMTTLTVMAASNVMYHQAHRHPSPFFGGAGPEQIAELQEVRPVPPPVRQVAARPRLAVVPQPVVTQETTASLPDAADDTGPIGNAEVYAVQKKLKELKLFSGEIDGYYGPMTADAIRKFEAGTGRTPEGALTPEVIDAIMAAPVGDPLKALIVSPQAEAEPPTATVRPANVYVAPAAAQVMPKPLPMPAPVAQQAEVPPLVFSQPQQQARPVQQQVQQPAQQQAPVLIARQVNTNIFDEMADGAADAFDSVASTVQEAFQQPESVRQVQAPARPVTPPAGVAVASTNPTVKATPAPANAQSSNDPELVAKVQRGLASLGFLAGAVDGVPGEATAKAIRNFEVYYNYPVTGKVTPQLVGMLEQAGAVI